MSIVHFFRPRLIALSLAVALLFLSCQPVECMPLQEKPAASNKGTAARVDRKLRSPGSSGEQMTQGSSSMDSVKAFQKLETDKITSFFVPADAGRMIQLSMLVTYTAEFTRVVRELLGEEVTPLLFSVSTLPSRTVTFDPTRLHFEQYGRVWHPRLASDPIEFLALNESSRFGGDLSDGEVHQGVILLPAWFDPQAPITLRYGDFHYLACFTQH
jgi:hypothetical protein